MIFTANDIPLRENTEAELHSFLEGISLPKLSETTQKISAPPSLLRRSWRQLPP
jgi:hypothetical protein